MRRHRLWKRLLTLAVCLLVVGLIRSMIPEYLPSESPRGPGRDGVASTDMMSVRLLDQAVTRTIFMPHSGGSAQTENVFIVVRVQIEPLQERIVPLYRIDGGDGRQYNPLVQNLGSQYNTTRVIPATRATQSFAFEVPESALAGAELVVLLPTAGQVQPMQQVIQFQLDDLGEILEEYTAEPDSAELVFDD